MITAALCTEAGPILTERRAVGRSTNCSGYNLEFRFDIRGTLAPNVVEFVQFYDEHDNYIGISSFTQEGHCALLAGDTVVVYSSIKFPVA